MTASMIFAAHADADADAHDATATRVVARVATRGSSWRRAAVIAREAWAQLK